MRPIVGSLVAQDIRYTYRGSDTPSIEGISVAATAGEFLAICGPSGCGKSTLLFTLGLLLTPDRGSVEFDGIIMSDQSDRERASFRAKSIGFVFQDAYLDRARSILSNVVEPAVFSGMDWLEAKSRAQRLLKSFGLAMSPERRAHGLSGGEAQRVGLCRALICEPRYILADEPTGNLDRDSEDFVLSRLRDMADAGKTVVVVSHSARIGDYATRVVRHEQGKWLSDPC